MKMAVALMCLLAGVGAVAAQRSLLTDPIALNPPPCEMSVADYLSAGEANSFGSVFQGTNGLDFPAGDASSFFLLKGPQDKGVFGRCARNLCFAFGQAKGIQLQLANAAPKPASRIAAKLVFPNAPGGAYFNNLPTYETPREGPNLLPSAGPIGRNNLVMSTLDDDGTFDVSPPTAKAGTFHPGPGNLSLAVVCGPDRDGFTHDPVPVCTLPDNEFQGWAVTNYYYTAATLMCPFGFTLGNVAANNLFHSDQTKYNPNNLFDQTGFPYLPDLISFCAPGERVYVNTAPGFTSGNPAGAPQGSPGYCVTITDVYFGAPTGVNPKYTGGKPDPTNPLCLEIHKALCFESASV